MVNRKEGNVTASEELELLRKEVVRLLQEISSLKEHRASEESPRLVDINHQLLEQVAELENRIKQIEKENKDFANLCVQVQEQNESITSLYVVSHR